MQVALQQGVISGFSSNQLNHLYTYVESNPLSLVDPYGLHGQFSRHKGRQKNRGGGRVGIVGCLFNCASYTEGDSSAKASASLSVGGAILVCSSPKNPQPKEPESQQCDDDNGGIYPNAEVTGGSASPPGRMGMILGGQLNADGSFCISIGPMLSLPSPSISLGDL